MVRQAGSQYHWLWMTGLIHRKKKEISMTQKKTTGSGGRDRLVAEAKKYSDDREKGYRERALKMFPWICGKCEREFEGKQLKELTVHHKDHNHDNNPPDGSNWELLCLYCHDNEHSRDSVAEWLDGTDSGEEEEGEAFTHNPFAGLGGLLKSKE